jgi:DNA-binding response OmpR family regulator
MPRFSPAAPERLLLVEDDAALTEMLTEYLGQAGYCVDSVAAGSAGLEALARRHYDALVLDLGLPDMDGLELCRQLRSRSDIPVLVLTARGDALDRIVGLELGADDYLAKPFVPRELLARMRALLRRRSGALQAANQALRFGRLEIDPLGLAAYLDGEPCALSANQVSLLLLLARNAGRVMSREAMLDGIKGERTDNLERCIDLHISRLRAVIESDPKHPRRIITIRGAGYVFAKAQD